MYNNSNIPQSEVNVQCKFPIFKIPVGPATTFQVFLDINIDNEIIFNFSDGKLLLYSGFDFHRFS